MFKRLKHFFNPTTNNIPIPEPITNLARVKSNVKIVWTPSKSPDVVSQLVKVMGVTGKVFIEKHLDPRDCAFSFSATKESKLIISIAPFNGVKYGQPARLEIIA